jgi:hypothetical protein
MLFLQLTSFISTPHVRFRRRTLSGKHHGTPLRTPARSAAPLRVGGQAKQALNIGHTKLYKLIADGRLAARKLDGRTLITHRA